MRSIRQLLPVPSIRKKRGFRVRPSDWRELLFSFNILHELGFFYLYISNTDRLQQAEEYVRGYT